MSYSQKMQSEAYFDQANSATLESDSAAADEYRPRKGQSLQRATTLISFFIGAAAVACVLGLAIPYLSQLNSEKPTNVLDWWLRLGGAKPDQTFEKFLHDRIKVASRGVDVTMKEPFAGRLDVPLVCPIHLDVDHHVRAEYVVSDSRW